MLQEQHHAGILSAFYLALRDLAQTDGMAVFRTAERFYGERRGRRMALRALRDGRCLDYAAYFAYGELLSTEGLTDVCFSAGQGRVDERVSRCPWAEEFIRLGCRDCGAFYCREIDASVVRGFNPDLYYELLGNIYGEGCCRFCYKDGSIRPGLFDQNVSSSNKRDFHYHCADVYQAFSHTVKMAAPGEWKTILGRVRSFLSKAYGEDFLNILDLGQGQDFERI